MARIVAGYSSNSTQVPITQRISARAERPHVIAFKFHPMDSDCVFNDKRWRSRSASGKKEIKPKILFGAWVMLNLLSTATGSSTTTTSLQVTTLRLQVTFFGGQIMLPENGFAYVPRVLWPVTISKGQKIRANKRFNCDSSNALISRSRIRLDIILICFGGGGST